ncbi:Copia protein [Cucumis melo var. makuwa]|uniref:Copia protein n=1 Tax=Cucumis melo var. makuwa TaxID=1194695 RepID=A0A5A7US38_CUCMM|nr:Copia protein [Cucumis melo var. makuwa]
MIQPPGYVNSTFPDYVCKLNKAIYGLKQAPRAWNIALTHELLKLGFINSKSDSSLFIFRKHNCVILFLVYVDDVIVTSNNSAEIGRLITMLDAKFALKDLGPLHYFLRFQIHYLESSFIMNQEKYIDDLLHKLQLTDLKPASSPSVLGKRLSISDGIPLKDPFMYQSTIVALQYLTNTRSNISYIVNHLSQFLQKPTDLHWQAVKRVLRYISGTKHYGILFQSNTDLSITAFSDADWASNINDRKSVAAYCVFVGNNLDSWSLKKQNVVARSSTESEYRALAHATSEIVWITQLLSELSILIHPKPILWCDNISVGALATNPVFHARTKHIEIDVHFVHDQVLCSALEVRYIPSSDQLADCLTKPLTHSHFYYLRSKLGGSDAHHPRQCHTFSIFLLPYNLRDYNPGSSAQT